MKHFLFAAALAVGVVAAGSADARRTVQPANGTVNASMMPDGDVLIQLQIPAKEYFVLSRDMKTARSSICQIDEADSGTTNTMYLVCGPAKPAGT